VLYNICKQNNDNTFFISKKEELESEWFEANDTIGICGATSTPLWLMEDVRNALLNY
jgi:4-hydroxy-3-methylbut-2-enyl diphosphate reductase